MDHRKYFDAKISRFTVLSSDRSYFGVILNWLLLYYNYRRCSARICMNNYGRCSARNPARSCKTSSKSLAQQSCSLPMQESCKILARPNNLARLLVENLARKWPNYVQDCKISTSLARWFAIFSIHLSASFVQDLARLFYIDIASLCMYMVENGTRTVPDYWHTHCIQRTLSLRGIGPSSTLVVKMMQDQNVSHLELSLVQWGWPILKFVANVSKVEISGKNLKRHLVFFKQCMLLFVPDYFWLCLLESEGSCTRRRMFCKTSSQVKKYLWKVQKQARDENTQEDYPTPLLLS